MSVKDLLKADVFKGKDRAEMAEIIGLSESRISELLSDKTLPEKMDISTRYLRNICNNTKITPEELYEAIAEKPAPAPKDGTMAAEIEKLKKENEKLLEDINWLKQQNAAQLQQLIKQADTLNKLVTKQTQQQHTATDDTARQATEASTPVHEETPRRRVEVQHPRDVKKPSAAASP